MSRWKLLVALITLPAALGGCSMCCGPFDCDYPIFQSRYTRMDPQYGRVGSIFSDPNVGPGTTALTNADVPIDERRQQFNPDIESPDDETDPFRGFDREELDIPPADDSTTTTTGSRR